MYSYNNMPQMNENMYNNMNNQTLPNMYQQQDDDRFAGGLLAPLFLGGVAGYAIGYNRPNNGGYGYGYPMPYPQYPVYNNNYYYPYY